MHFSAAAWQNRDAPPRNFKPAPAAIDPRRRNGAGLCRRHPTHRRRQQSVRHRTLVTACARIRRMSKSTALGGSRVRCSLLARVVTFAKFLDHFFVELRNVRRPTTCHETLIRHDRLVDPARTGVLQIRF